MILGIAALQAVCMVGCSSKDDGLSTEQHQTQDRFTQIMQKTNGDWEKLSNDDKKFIIDDLSHGNEDSAKMMFKMRAMRGQGAPGGGPGGPPSK